MKDSKRARKAEARLWYIMLGRGPGTIKHTEKAIGLKTDGLRNVKNNSGLRLWHLLDALEVLDVPETVFFNDVFGGGIITTAEERFMARGAELAASKLVDLPVMAEETKPDRLTEKDLERLDAARFEDPRAAAEQAAGVARLAARDGRRGDAVAAVARQGSALRVAEEWEPAWVCVWWALKNAPDGAAVAADLFIRSGSVVADFGEFSDAAEMADTAASEYFKCGSKKGIARAAFCHGLFLLGDDLHHQAVDSLTLALELLPATDMRYKLAAEQNLGLAFVGMKNFEAADRHAGRAEALASESAFSPQLRWLRARIAAGRERTPDAIELYRATVSELRDFPGDAALAGAELCRTYLHAGHIREAIQEAIDLAALAIPRRQNGIVAAAIVDLRYAAQAGDLTLEVVDRTIGHIRQALRRRAAADARPGSCKASPSRPD